MATLTGRTMKKRGRPKTTSGDKKACQLREANRRAYAKKNFQGNQHTSAFDKLWASLKEKHKEFEGTRLEKSIKKPIFLKEWKY